MSGKKKERFNAEGYAEDAKGLTARSANNFVGAGAVVKIVGRCAPKE
jgi:hypothetical protein